MAHQINKPSNLMNDLIAFANDPLYDVFEDIQLFRQGASEALAMRKEALDSAAATIEHMRKVPFDDDAAILLKSASNLLSEYHLARSAVALVAEIDDIDKVNAEVAIDPDFAFANPSLVVRGALSQWREAVDEWQELAEYRAKELQMFSVE